MQPVIDWSYRWIVDGILFVLIFQYFSFMDINTNSFPARLDEIVVDGGDGCEGSVNFSAQIIWQRQVILQIRQ